jgi:oligopeptide/dipeptide ABC transporter ATP-binding protein
MASIPLIQARDLKKHFPVIKGLLFAKAIGWIKAVDGIDFNIWPGDTFGLVGESGCGKTTTSKMILMLEKKTFGSLLFEGEEIGGLHGEALTRFRASVQAVFQDPFSSLNPRMQIGRIISEPIIENKTVSKTDIRERIEFLIEQVGLPGGSAKLYPHEFSGGQRQRIAVARALALNPRLIILDEPVSALDVSVRAQVLNMLKDLQERFGLTYLLIAHNLATVRYLSTFVAVMYLGKIMEAAHCHELFTNPLHPYTKALHSAALPSHPSVKREVTILSGEVPSPFNPPKGCRFHPRCRYASAPCAETEPNLTAVDNDHSVACRLYPAAGSPDPPVRLSDI